MRTLLVPLQMDASGRWATTSDPATILRQQIVDILMTNFGERIFLPEHGANLRDFVFAPLIPAVLNAKADEIRSLLSAKVSFGEILQVQVNQVEGTDSTIRVAVVFRVIETGQPQTVVRTFSGLVDEETQL